MIHKVTGSPAEQQEIGACILWAQQNWEEAGWIGKLTVLVFGRLQRIEHLGTLFVLMWRHDVPYLVYLREADR